MVTNISLNILMIRNRHAPNAMEWGRGRRPAGAPDGSEHEYLIEGDRVWLHSECNRFHLAARGEGAEA